jgi:hypothetical protein
MVNTLASVTASTPAMGPHLEPRESDLSFIKFPLQGARWMDISFLASNRSWRNDYFAPLSVLKFAEQDGWWGNFSRQGQP